MKEVVRDAALEVQNDVSSVQQRQILEELNGDPPKPVIMQVSVTVGTMYISRSALTLLHCMKT